MQLLKQVARPLDYSGDFAATMIAAEVRSHFASLPSDQRLSDLRAAVEAGDAVTMKAVGAGPAFLEHIPVWRTWKGIPFGVEV